MNSTSTDSPHNSSFAEPSPVASWPRMWDRVEGWLERGSESLNPILVKEARQALKSRQFITTFSLLLLFGWGWSLLGVALLSPGVYFAPGGRVMLTGYLIILLIPMTVVVPFSAFRSLAAEREDGTFELVSITALAARQIVSGKLGSAVAQMLVYYSAIAPCIAFTYLLRGIDILTILMLLYYVFVVSVLLSSIGLLVATLSRSRHWQVVLSVALVIALFVADVVASYVGAALIWESVFTVYDDMGFWIAQLAIATFAASYLVLFVLSAAARISFVSDNRSTRIRVVLLVQQLLWVFWMGCLWLQYAPVAELLYVFVSIAGVHWYLAGSLMSGETGVLSPRVRRSLPQSLLGRMLGTWFNPGSGTGYIFAVLNMWSLSLLTVAAALVSDRLGVAPGGNRGVISLSIITAAYVTIYLGVGHVVIRFLRQHVFIGLVLPLLIHVVIAVGGAAVPFIVAGWLQGFSFMDYSYLQFTNWVWTAFEAAEGRLWLWPGVVLTVFALTAAMLIIHLLLATREVEQTRLITPQRVIEDELQLHPETSPPRRRRSSPWDDD